MSLIEGIMSQAVLLNEEQPEFLADVLEGLTHQQKTLPCKYFYNLQGSELYERITTTQEYYPTRTEIQILHQWGKDITRHFGQNPCLIEYGSGSSIKTRMLLDSLPQNSIYAPIDISARFLMSVSEQLSKIYRFVDIHPIVADYSNGLTLPKNVQAAENKIAYFPGSSIGNFTPIQAIQFLTDMRKTLGKGSKLFIGYDVIKPIPVLEKAYNDSQGYTAAFNLNLLKRINQELGADFDLTQFMHRAIYNSELQRIEMHLISLCDQTVTINGHRFTFKKAESIHTENSYKYSLESFNRLLTKAGWQPIQSWSDEKHYFNVQLAQDL